MFEVFGIRVDPPLKFSGVLIICGSGRCLWDDLSSIHGLYDKSDVMGVNDSIMHLPRLKHAYSNDARLLSLWISARRSEYMKVEYMHSCNKPSQYEWPWPGHGTSSLNAVYTGLALGYDKIILAGVPLDDSGHYWQAPWEKSNFSKEVGQNGKEIQFWSKASKEVFNGKVKAVSGRLMSIL